MQNRMLAFRIRRVICPYFSRFINYNYWFWFFTEKPADDVSFDDIIDDIGGFGLWQLVIFVFISIFDILAAFAVLLPVFAGKILI